MYYVYVIKSVIDGSHYVGLTNDVDRRIKEHNQGGNFSTKTKKPWNLIFVEEVINRVEARRLEKFFKSGYGREIVAEIESTLKL